MAQYQWITQKRAGAQIADVTGLTARRVMFQEKQPPIASASLRVEDLRARRDDLGGFTEGEHELKIIRDNVPLETVFQLTDAKVAGTANAMRLDFEWQGIASYLQDALVLPQAAAFSGQALPWGWINAYQGRAGGSAYAITQGPVQGYPPNRQKLVQKEQSVFDAINDLATTADGFDWAIDDQRRYREWHSQRGRDTGIVLEPGVNVLDWGYSSSTAPGKIVSDLTVSGPPGSQSVSVNDPVARARYGRREAAVTLFGDAEASGNVQGQIQARATSGIAAYVAPVVVPTIKLRAGHPSIPWGSYWLGDIVVFRVRVGNYDFINQPYRIVQIELQIDAAENETITLGVNAL